MVARHVVVEGSATTSLRIVWQQISNTFAFLPIIGWQGQVAKDSPEFPAYSQVYATFLQM